MSPAALLALAARDHAARLLQLAIRANDIAEARVRLHRISSLTCDACRTPAGEFIGNAGPDRHLLPDAERFGLALVEDPETRRRAPAILCPGCLSRIRHSPITHRGTTRRLVARIPSAPPDFHPLS